MVIYTEINPVPTVHTKMGRKIKTANIIKNHIYRNFVKEM
jgi:hypothetical protein